MRDLCRRAANSLVCVVLVVCGSAMVVHAQTPSGAIATTEIPYLDVLPVLDALPEETVPADLKTKSEPELEIVWPRWLSSRDASIRARAARGANTAAAASVSATIDAAVAALRGTVAARTVHRVALVSPALDTAQ